MSYFSTNFTLGILGGGQLGKMLLSETLKYDIRTIVLDPSAEAPARFGCHAFFQGDLMDYDTVYQFGKQADLLTFEIENVNVDALERLEQEGVKVYPTPASLRIIQDKGAQKAFYKAHKIPTAPFEAFDSPTLLAAAVAEGRWTYPFVWKSTRFGYDGNGVKIVRNLQDLHALPEGPCIAEQCAEINKELAVIVARSPKGEVVTYPVVEMEFHPEANQVEYVLCPARIAETISSQARKIALQVAEAFGSIGLLAVELFLTKGGEIWVNEVAPRPHNSGHYSIEASYTSQFEQHLRAILDLPLGSTESKVAGVMVNLVGAEGYAGNVIYEHIEDVLSLPGVTPHIYGKRQTRPFRKMGHITITHRDIEQARLLAQRVKETIKVISRQ
ncbi:5-(carboxyamino)imidazole ribonucleotide synthase [Capnocytophaga granulosa]|uniref:N5-carboxyaminoimidazole ribonucleotide synthase n=1 Tax=Capnocytophaga granulosa TaxID=45242 RepID=A0A1H2YPK9_9FLAO|nr:5-(carboxyamino)imidazole ribonucleotide synthase [Capnocytophaga granulosa]EPD27508.1 phosphoribosylaminoimidazole carboxylase, ATPase subunit [Capnocytophaga granulosa ATCC 51502]SDX06574.1 5-(carboxyamino)imidazole ribonucleotide synthase [Capnocytophaga granulosa]SUX18644.1 N5-carboxyaminoimidazole ribonucleotide synthase [Capnocytophaga granulosa]